MPLITAFLPLKTILAWARAFPPIRDWIYAWILNDVERCSQLGEHREDKERASIHSADLYVH
jgi:hypothetical protein